MAFIFRICTLSILDKMMVVGSETLYFFQELASRQSIIIIPERVITPRSLRTRRFITAVSESMSSAGKGSEDGRTDRETASAR